MTVEPPMGPRGTGDTLATGSRIVPDFTRCRSCDTVVRTVPIDDGSMVLANYAVCREPEEGLVAFNPATQKGWMIGAGDVGAARGWMTRGVVIYRPHELTCVRPGGGMQLQIGGQDA